MNKRVAFILSTFLLSYTLIAHPLLISRIIERNLRSSYLKSAVAPAAAAAAADSNAILLFELDDGTQLDSVMFSPAIVIALVLCVQIFIVFVALIALTISRPNVMNAVGFIDSHVFVVAIPVGLAYVGTQIPLYHMLQIASPVLVLVLLRMETALSIGIHPAQAASLWGLFQLVATLAGLITVAALQLVSTVGWKAAGLSALVLISSSEYTHKAVRFATAAVPSLHAVPTPAERYALTLFNHLFVYVMAFLFTLLGFLWKYSNNTEAILDSIASRLDAEDYVLLISDALVLCINRMLVSTTTTHDFMFARMCVPAAVLVFQHRLHWNELPDTGYLVLVALFITVADWAAWRHWTTRRI